MAVGMCCAAHADCCAAAGAPSVENVAISKLESRELPPGAVKKRVLDQLSNMLHLEPYPSGGPPPKLPLSEIWFRTTPYATDLPNLCAYQEIAIDFRPAVTGKFDAETKTVPYRIEEKTYYRFVGENSRAPTAGLELNDIMKANGSCTKLDPEKDFLLRAADEDIALEAIQIVDVMSEHVSHKSVSFEQDCSEYGAQCKHDIGKASSSDIEYVSQCDAMQIQNSSARCWNIFLRTKGLGLELKVYAEKRGVDWRLFRIIPYAIVSTSDPRGD